MNELINSANTIIWDYILIYLIGAAGIYFTVRSRFIQLRLFRHSASLLWSGREHKAGKISSFQAFTTSMAARVGTGNIGGVAVALYVGGPGAIFWMWAIALIGMCTSVAENTLAQLYKEPSDEGTFKGGPAYYMQRALGMRWLGIIFGLCLISAFGIAFNAVQSVAIAESMQTAFNFDPLMTGIVIAALAALVVFGGVKRIAQTTEILVPFMAIGYVLIALWVVIANISQVPALVTSIVSHAFGLEAAVGGGGGWLVKEALANGIRRGMFSNEAGMGSAPNAAATAAPVPNHPVTQGLIGSFGVFVDTIIICSATAFIIMLSGVLEPGSGLTNVALTQTALATHIPFGKEVLAIAILFFAFSTILANSFYAEMNIRFITNQAWAITAYRIFLMGLIVFGATLGNKVAWGFADMTMGMMAIINLVVILILSKQVFALFKHYQAQRAQGLSPEFKKDDLPELKDKIASGVWE